MSDEELKTKIQNLENYVHQQKQSVKKVTKIYLVMYSILVVFVLIYTTVIIRSLKSYTDPEKGASELLAIADSYVPSNEKFVNIAKKEIPKLVENRLGDIDSLFLTMEGSTKKYLDKMSDNILQKFDTEIIPSLMMRIKKNYPHLKSQIQKMSTEEKANELLDILMVQIKEEIDNRLDDSFVKELFNLRVRLDRMVTKKNDLTKSEEAERRLIIYWSALSNDPHFGENLANKFFDKMDSFHNLIKGADFSWIDRPESITNPIENPILKTKK